MNAFLTAFLTVCGVGIILWGFDRYRRLFVKFDLVVALLAGIGLIFVGIAPTVFDPVRFVFDMRKRYVFLSLIAIVSLLGLVFYLLTQVRNTRFRLNRLVRELTVEQAGTSSHDDPTVSIILAAYNEAATIEQVLASLPERIHDHCVEPIVVSDGSTDGTAAVASQTGVTVVEHPLNQGQGGALKTGFNLAIERGTDIVVTMDADGQHPAEELDNLIGPIVADEADYVFGSRYKGANRSGNGAVRRYGIAFFSVVISILTDTTITDCTNGFRAIRARELHQLTLTEERFSAPELIIEAKKNGLRIKEIPVIIEERDSGTSKKPKLKYGFGLARTILTTWLR